MVLSKLLCGAKIRVDPLSQECHQYCEILSTTNNFDEDLVIGRALFGNVYKGEFFNGTCNVLAAIKRLDPESKQGGEEFRAEVELLPKLRHCNLITLIGYCNYEKERILVYEYSPRGTLEDHLHKLATPFSFRQRVNICLGAARGLMYLHSHNEIGLGITHRDVKSSNIVLVDNNNNSWDAKIADFGLSKTSCLTNQQLTVVEAFERRKGGSFGYMDPNCKKTGWLNRRSDVYSFGVVMLEVLCRKRAMITTPPDNEYLDLVTCAQPFLKKKNFEHMIDSELLMGGHISSKCLEKYVGIVQGCLHVDPMQRPTMDIVVDRIESFLLTIPAAADETNTSLEDNY